MADECSALDIVVLDEKLKIFCQYNVIVLWVVGGIAMVSGVDSVYRSLQVANESSLSYLVPTYK